MVKWPSTNFDSESRICLEYTTKENHMKGLDLLTFWMPAENERSNQTSWKAKQLKHKAIFVNTFGTALLATFQEVERKGLDEPPEDSH